MGTNGSSKVPVADTLPAPDLWDLGLRPGHKAAGDTRGTAPAVDINSLFASGGNEPWAAALSPDLTAADTSDTRTASRAATQQSRMSRWFSSEEDQDASEAGGGARR